jgi:hypothetical protein
MTEELMPEYLTNVFVPYSEWLRENHVSADERDVLLIYYVGAHVSDSNFRLLGENRIITVVFPAHSIILFQAFDLIFCGAMKHNKVSLANGADVVSVQGQIWKLIRAYEQTATSFTIQSYFHKAGLSPNTQTGPLKLECNEALRENDGRKDDVLL